MKGLKEEAARAVQLLGVRHIPEAVATDYIASLFEMAFAAGKFAGFQEATHA